ncbi:MAG: NAD(P)-dependent oxidoreductase [DPANN group archaeon]|nr:NAD(P)-dependent oxidoreductase [DPANN group archaeon]
MALQKILITGISGFLGSHIAKGLIDAGHAVHGFSRRPCSLASVSCVQGDILDAEKVAQACEGMDVVIHLAGVTEHDALVGHPLPSFEVNLIGTHNVLKACQEQGVSHLIYPSSGKVYGRPKSLPIDEQHPLQPNNLLGASKRIIEHIISFTASSSDAAFTILRIFNIYGPGQRRQFLIPTILDQLAMGKKKVVLGDLTVKKDYLFIADLVEAVKVVIAHPGNGLNIFNAGSGVSSAPQDILAILGKLLGRKIEVESTRERLRPEEHYEERADISKLSALGWKPKVSLEQGLKKILQMEKDLPLAGD